ncbi:MAG: STAS domain-containing protein [Synergistetes bacterium]|nr:STAS domain-containing protein [Synergistota bacterium]MDW8192336.1 STAS domain-containing protein [Synergistota bacterium]
MSGIAPIIGFKDYLVVPLQRELSDKEVDNLQRDILDRISQRDIKGVIIDVSALDVIDSYMSYVFIETSLMLRAMGCYMALCGIKPHVALTLAQIGISFKSIFTVSSLDKAIEVLSRSY